MRFTSCVELGGKTATGIEVPAEVIEQLGSGRRPAVTATVNGHSYRTTVGAMAGRSMIPLSAENRTAAGLAAGDAVEVDLELDTAPRVVEVPADLAEALAADPVAARAYAGLSYSRQRGLVEPVVAARAAETRQRRIDKAVADLAAGKA